ncbi:RNA methyltransferase [Vulcanococcus limneticus]|uniref:RNA methyltransferase n=1 Tax=Vulcanococcus limneticus TaxID=2170428 RepID=UPI00398BD398
MSDLAARQSAPIVVVLVEPAGPLNVGGVARLCANFAIAELRLVAPRCDHLGEEAMRMAVHGGALLQRARLFPDLAAALADCRRVVASCGQVARDSLPLQSPASALGWLLAGAALPSGEPPPPSALVFGREDRGLSTDELLQAGQVLRIATGEAYASLNLAQAAAICLHELHQARLRQAQSEGPGPPTPLPVPTTVAAPQGGETRADLLEEPASRGAVEAMLQDAEDLLLAVGFLYPHTAHARMAKLRGLLQRAQIRDGEVALVRGMVRQLRWASQRRSP